MSSAPQRNSIYVIAGVDGAGKSSTAPMTREVLRQAEPDEEKRPSIHVGGY